MQSLTFPNASQPYGEVAPKRIQIGINRSSLHARTMHNLASCSDMGQLFLLPSLALYRQMEEKSHRSAQCAPGFALNTARGYRPRTASVYSLMLPRVIATPFLGNTFFDATIPLSVTLIMSQFGDFRAQSPHEDLVLQSISKVNRQTCNRRGTMREFGFALVDSPICDC